MVLCEEAKTRVSVGFKLPQKIEVQVGKHQGSVLPPIF